MAAPRPSAAPVSPTARPIWKDPQWIMIGLTLAIAITGLWQANSTSRALTLSNDQVRAEEAKITAQQEEILKGEREKQIRDWQSLVIYNIIRKAGIEGITFEEILQKYRVEATAFPSHDIPKNELTEDALRFLLLEMAKSNTAFLYRGDRYAVQVATVNLYFEKSVQVPEAKLAALTLLETESGKYTIAELIGKLNHYNEFLDGVALTAVVELVTLRGLIVDSDYKVWSVTKPIPKTQ